MCYMNHICPKFHKAVLTWGYVSVVRVRHGPKKMNPWVVPGRYVAEFTKPDSF